MTEKQVAFLYNIATKFQNTPNGHTNTILKSYYSMRCHEITRSYGLPNRHFSSNLRCFHCSIELKPENYEVEIKPIKLSKNQRRRLRSLKDNNFNLQKKNRLNGNELVKTCNFCKYTTTQTLLKPNRTEGTDKQTNKQKTEVLISKKTFTKPEITQNKSNDIKPKLNNSPRTEINVYNNTKDVFCLTNNKNSLSQLQEKPVIKNLKRKKDKFAGLCKEAVLSAARITQNKEKNNKLNMFLKPSK